MLQTFFALDTCTGQPIGCIIGSPGANTARSTIDLIEMIKRINKKALLLADKEHITENLTRNLNQNSQFDLLVPVLSTKRIQKIATSADYKSKWAGYAIAETWFNFAGSKEKYRLLSQRWSIEDFFNFDGAMGFDRASTFNLNIRYGKMSLALLSQAATYQLRQKLPKPYNR